jgi:hypothetical protein
MSARFRSYVSQYSNMEIMHVCSVRAGVQMIPHLYVHKQLLVSEQGKYEKWTDWGCNKIKIEDHTLLTLHSPHIFSPPQKPRYTRPAHNIPKRQTPTCASLRLRDSGPTEYPHNAQLSSTECCTYSLHLLGIPPWAIFSPRCQPGVSTMYIRYQYKALGDEISTSRRRFAYCINSYSRRFVNLTMAAS